MQSSGTLVIPFDIQFHWQAAAADKGFIQSGGIIGLLLDVDKGSLAVYLLRRILVYKPKDLNRDGSPRFSTLRDKNGWI